MSNNEEEVQLEEPANAGGDVQVPVVIQGNNGGRDNIERDGDDNGGSFRGGWLPQPRLPKFGGDCGEVEDFVEEARRVFEAYQMRPAIGV